MQPHPLGEFCLPPLLLELRERAKEGRDPTCADETLAVLLDRARRLGAKEVLEIGAAEGLTAAAVCLATDARVTAIELDPTRAAKARENFLRFGIGERVTLHEGDAGEILPMLTGEFDLIFSDGPKAQYLRYLPDCKRLLRKGGLLLSDDVLLYGWVRGEPPKKRRMLIEHIRDYLRALEGDPDLKTEILDIAEGLAVSEKLS